MKIAGVEGRGLIRRCVVVQEELGARGAGLLGGIWM